jgi:hypothetical protein
MAKAKLAFKERDIMRALRACRKEGLPVGRVVVEQSTGDIIVVVRGDHADDASFDQQTAASVGGAP